MAIAAWYCRNSAGAPVAAYFCRWNTASFCALDHRLSPPTYARTADKEPRLKIARSSRPRTIAAKSQIMVNGDLVSNPALERGASRAWVDRSSFTLAEK